MHPLSITAVLVVLLVFGPACARVQRAELAGQEKAHELEVQRVERDLEKQEEILKGIQQELKSQEQTVQTLLARSRSGNPPTESEIESARKELERLLKRLREGEARHAESQAEVQRLISPPTSSR
jgi:septal ring factor EnvC (AmiA/AmiB activator)